MSRVAIWVFRAIAFAIPHNPQATSDRTIAHKVVPDHLLHRVGFTFPQNPQDPQNPQNPRLCGFCGFCGASACCNQRMHLPGRRGWPATVAPGRGGRLCPDVSVSLQQGQAWNWVICLRNPSTFQAVKQVPLAEAGNSGAFDPRQDLLGDISPELEAHGAERPARARPGNRRWRSPC